jgi:hypothetical protein
VLNIRALSSQVVKSGLKALALARVQENLGGKVQKSTSWAKKAKKNS